MPVLTFLAIVGLALVALFFVADATLEMVGSRQRWIGDVEDGDASNAASTVIVIAS